MTEQYIVIEETDTDGFPCDPAIYYVDTDAEIAIAERALSEAGVGEAEVWVGEGEDAVKTSTKIFAKRALSDEEIDSVATDWLKGDLAECADGEVLDVEGPVGCDFDDLDCCKYQLSLYDTMGTRDDDELSAVVKSYREQLKAHYETIATDDLKRALSDEEIDSVAADWLKADLAQCADGEELDDEEPIGCDFEVLDYCKYQLNLYDTMGTRDVKELSAVAKSYHEQLATHYETISTDDLKRQLREILKKRKKIK